MTGKRMMGWLGLLGLSFMGLQAEEPEAVEAVEKDFQAYMSSLDSMINVWHVRPKMEPLVLDSINERAEQLIEELPDSVYIARLAAISSPMQFTFNSQVKSYIRLYTQRRRDQVENMLGLSHYYFPIFEEALDAAGLPHELKYLPVIESALNPRALSRAGASGIWQFMYRSEEHTSELQSRPHLVCRLLLEKKNNT